MRCFAIFTLVLLTLSFHGGSSQTIGKQLENVLRKRHPKPDANQFTDEFNNFIRTKLLLPAIKAFYLTIKGDYPSSICTYSEMLPEERGDCYKNTVVRILHQFQMLLPDIRNCLDNPSYLHMRGEIFGKELLINVSRSVSSYLHDPKSANTTKPMKQILSEGFVELEHLRNETKVMCGNSGNTKTLPSVLERISNAVENILVSLRQACFDESTRG